MGKNIKISIDFEGPFGMYPYIKSQNSIKKYYQLDESIRFILDYHKKNKIIITLGILGVTAIKEFKDLIKVISSIDDDYPQDSLIYRLKNDFEFFKLVLENKEVFLKGKVLEDLNIKNNNYIEIACHSFSHIHIFEDIYSKNILEKEISESLKIIQKFLKKNSNVSVYISPKNQINSKLISILKKFKILKYRSSSKINLYSENYGKKIITKYFYKFARKYEKFNLPFNNLLNRSLIKNLIDKDNEYIDSGYFLEFPKYEFLYNRYLSSFLKYVKKQIDDKNDINIWFHPHNMLVNLELSKRYYKSCHKILSKIKDDYVFSKL